MKRLTDDMLRDLARRFCEHDPKCPVCDGDGFVEYDEHQNDAKCSACGGTGDFALSAEVTKNIVEELLKLREILGLPLPCGWDEPQPAGGGVVRWEDNDYNADELLAVGATIVRACRAARREL